METKKSALLPAVAEVFLAFLKLGLTSFGGPIAHLGYFREELVVRRRWLDEAAYADIVSLCQFLPGPASSKVGFAIGMARSGFSGGLAAWLGFTLPSAILMVMFAYGAAALDGPVGDAAIHGLKIVAVSIVAQAIWGMAQTLTPDARRILIALGAALLLLLAGGAFAQIAAIGVGGLAGLWLCRDLSSAAPHPVTLRVSRHTGLAALSLFFILLIGLPLISDADSPIAVFAAFYRAGALVFGGGHVVLPLLEQAIVEPGWVDAQPFLAGYGAAQAVPGPLFTFAAYLGTILNVGPSGIAGAAFAVVAIFLPGMLLLIGVLPFWDDVRARPTAQAAMRGANAAVVGILAAALYNPVWTAAIRSAPDAAIAIVGFALLTVWRLPPIIVVGLTVLASVVSSAW